MLITILVWGLTTNNRLIFQRITTAPCNLKNVILSQTEFKSPRTVIFNDTIERTTFCSCTELIVNVVHINSWPNLVLEIRDPVSGAFYLSRAAARVKISFGLDASEERRFLDFFQVCFRSGFKLKGLLVFEVVCFRQTWFMQKKFQVSF